MMSQGLPEQMKLRIVVVDDHPGILDFTVRALRQKYPEAEIIPTQTAQSAQEQVDSSQPDLVVVDLSIPEMPGDEAQPDKGIQLLRTLMESYPTLNIVVQSAKIAPLVLLKPAIDIHKAGFVVADKSLPIEKMLEQVNAALDGSINTPRELRSRLEVKPDWIKVLKLVNEGLQDKEIATQLDLSERTVRNYLEHLQNALGVYREDGRNIRIQTINRAREVGLID